MAGKINHTQLSNNILGLTGANRSEVICGPAFGIDVSVISIGNGQGLAMASDPLSFLPSLGLQESAWLSVHLMANDMGTTGYAPMYVQMVLNLNDNLSQQEIADYWNYVHEYCSRIGVAVTGGHTGLVFNQQTTISGGGTMSLVAPLDNILTANQAKPGDGIIVTGYCAMSSAAILAMSFPKYVTNKIGQQSWQLACDLFYQTSSLDAALVASGNHTVTRMISAMHDVTEGGVLGAIYEMAIASGLGVKIVDEQLPMCEEAVAVCNAFTLDPRFVIGAGATIIACPDKYCEPVIQRLKNAGISAAYVGQFSGRDEALQWMKDGQLHDLPYHEVDAYWATFGKALQKELK